MNGFFLHWLFWLSHWVLVGCWWFDFFLLWLVFILSVVLEVVFGRLRDGGVVGFVLSGLLNFHFVVILIFSVGWCGPDGVNFFGRERLEFVLKEDHAVIFLDFA